MTTKRGATTAAICGLLFLNLWTAHPLWAQVTSPAAEDAGGVFSDHFATGRVCAMCHSAAPRATALRDAKDRPIGPHDLWKTSMMAHSTSDPLWRAVVAAEVAANPTRRAEIETKCLRCHAPMASVQAQRNDQVPSRKEFLDGASIVAQLASDGVSCTACHQFLADGLGSDASFSGEFTLGQEGNIFGPHERPFAMPMFRHTGFVPTVGHHMRDSKVCASCHTLFTESLAVDGSFTGHSLLEQGPYVEWENSHYNDERGEASETAASCQDCHVPTVDEDGSEIRTRIARNPGGRDFPPVRPRSPFGRHVFVGGNTLMPSILRQELADAGARDEVLGNFDRAIEATRRLLRESTASIAITEARQLGRRLEVTVSVENLTGHKLPTAYPSRRVWIRLTVSDAAGRVVFGSGQFDDRGRIVDLEGEVLSSELVGGPVELHCGQIDTPSQVQIYESVMEDADGGATYSLLRGARYRKDNRLLPAGWSREHRRGELTAPVAVESDEDFAAGADAVRYVVDGLPGRGPFKIEASLYYQVLGARYAAELLTHEVPEMTRFARLYADADPRPEVLASAEKTIAGEP